MIFLYTLDHFLQELMLNPNEIFVYDNGRACSVYIPETEEFVFLDGDFSGTEEERTYEVERQLRRLGIFT